MKRLYAEFHTYIEGDLKGNMNLHTLTTPVIEVADDGKTAKGLWISPGVECPRVPLFGGEHQAAWCWIKYGVDFAKEDGKWKVCGQPDPSSV